MVVNLLGDVVNGLNPGVSEYIENDWSVKP